MRSVLGYMLLLMGVLFFSCHRASELLPIEVLQGLEVYGEPDLSQALDKPMLVLIHFDKLTCTTCTNKHLKSMAPWHDAYAKHFGFVATINDYDPGYFRNLRRIGGIRGPILIEEEALLHQGFYVALYDTRTLELVERLELDIHSDPELAKFHEHIREIYLQLEGDLNP